MTGALNNVLVVTGGTSGIGASLVAQAVAANCDVFYSGSRDLNSVPEELRSLNATYVQADVADAAQVQRLRDAVMGKIDSEAPLWVVASAGISKRKDPVKVARMRATNIDGTQNLLDAFEEPLKGRSKSRFIGLGSIVAAEKAPMQGDEEYEATKSEIQRISTVVADSRGIRGACVIPGLVDTPMTRVENPLAAPLLLLGAVLAAGKDESHLLRAELLASSGLAAWSSNADVLRAILGSSLSAVEDLEEVEKGFKRDPELKRAGALYYKKYAAPAASVVDRAFQIFTGLDIAISPDTVAASLLSAILSDSFPADGILKVYSRSGANRILSLLGAKG